MRLALCLIAMGIIACSAQFIAIDLGSEFLKVASIRPGKVPIQVVVNEMSRRKSPALVGLIPNTEKGGLDRVRGEEAFSFAVRYPETSFSRARDLLARPAGHPLVTKMLQDHLLPFEVVAHPNRSNCSSVKAGPDPDAAVHSAEELVASILQYAREIAEAHTGGAVQDAVIAVPAFFGQAQRQALIESAGLAGLNVMGIINSHAAAALQFGIERDFTNKTQNLILYDMGSGSTEVSLVRFSSYPAKDASGKATRISQLEVRDVDWDPELGSNLLDVALAKHFTAKFADKHSYDVNKILSNQKSMAKMKKQVRRTKEMLSANSNAPFSVEEFYENKDFQSSISREEFEGLVAGFFDRAASPLLRIIERNGLKPEEIDGVELLGGGSRVPRLQAVLSESLGGRGLDRHLDADEATVLGASLFAANLSTSFRLRKFGLTDMSMYGVQMTMEEIHQEEQAASEVTDVRNLLPYMKRLPIKRVVTFSNVSKDPIRFSIAYNSSTSSGLPPGVDEPHLASFEVTGINKAIERYNTSGVINLRFEADYGGVFKLDKAEAIVEYTVMEEKIVEVPVEGSNSTKNETSSNSTINLEETNSTSSDDSAEVPADESSESHVPEEPIATPSDGDDSTNATAANATESKNKTASVKRIQVPRKKVARVPLTVGGKGWAREKLSGDSLASSTSTLAQWVLTETVKRDNAAAKNDLESYIIKTREAIETDELLIKVSTEEQRSAFVEQLTAMEDWLYSDEGEGQGAVEFRAKLKSLKDVGEPIKDRAQEADLRPKMLDHLRKEVDLKSKVANAWPESKPWINETEQADVIKAINDFVAYLDGKEAEQANKQPHEPPAFLVNDLATQFEKVNKLFTKISNKKKPKPPPVNDTSVNGTDSNSTATNQTDAEPSDGEGAKQESEGAKDAKSNDTKKAKAEADKKKAEADKKAKTEADKKKAKTDSKKDKEKAQAESKRKEEMKKKMDEKKKNDKKARTEL